MDIVSWGGIDPLNVFRHELDYEMCKKAALLLTDPFVRFVAETANNEILSGKVEVTKKNGGEASEEERDEAERILDEMGTPFMDQVWTCGLAVVRYVPTKRKRGEKYPDKKAVVITEGFGEWTRLQIVTHANTGDREYVLLTRDDRGRYAMDPPDSYDVFDNFGRRPGFGGRVNSVLASIVEVYDNERDMEEFIRYAAENMAKPVIVTEPSLGALGGLNMNDVMSHAAGFEAHLSDGRAKEFEMHMNDAELEAAVKQQRDLFEKYVGIMTDGSRTKEKDQSWNALRPLPSGHKVARHLPASMRSDVDSAHKSYQETVAAAFNIDRATLFSGGYGQGRTGEGAVERSEKFMMLSFNKNRRSVGKAFTDMYNRTAGWNRKRDAAKKILVKDRDADPNLPRRKMEAETIMIKILEAPPIKFGELCDHMKCGLLQFDDYKQMAEAMLGRELSGTGKIPEGFSEVKD